MIALCPNPFRDIGLDFTLRAQEMLREDGFETVICPLFAEDEPEAEPYYITILNCIKHFDEGIQVQTLAYSGMTWSDAENTLVKAHDADPDRVRLFAMHNAWEFNRKAELLPKLFARAKELGEV